VYPFLSLFRVGVGTYIVQGQKRSFIVEIQKANGVAPKTGSVTQVTSTRMSLKSSFPKRRAEVLRFGACLYFFSFPFSPGVPFHRVLNRGNLT
jgi:hypothetical protein